MNPARCNSHNRAGSRIKLQSKRRLGTLDSVPQNTRSFLTVGILASASSTLVVKRDDVSPRIFPFDDRGR